MIGWIHGILREKHPPVLLVDTGGVGYEMEAPMTTFYDLPATGEPVTLYLHHIVREDAQHLYAFARRAERDVFRQLLRVSGVGAKLGLAILSGLDAADSPVACSKATPRASPGCPASARRRRSVS